MKVAARLVLTLAMMLGFSVAVSAQNRVGIKGGVTLASADVHDLQGTFDTDNRTGWGAGVFLTLGRGPISIQPELNAVELGFKAPGLPTAPEVKLRYLAPTVLLKVGLPLPVVRPSVFAGASVGLEMSCTIAGTDCENSPFQLETGTDATGVFGADVDVALGGTALRFDVRYAIGFKDIREASDVWTEIKNRAWLVSVGLGFRL
jgi:hypothetical protein